MHNIPLRLGLVITPLAGVMVSKAINNGVPKWLVPPNQFCFYRYNQVAFDTGEDHEPTSQIIQPQVSGLLYTASVFSQSLVQNWRFEVYAPRSSPSWRDSFAHVNGVTASCPIQIGDSGVQLEIADVVQTINPGPNESARRR